MSEKRRGRISRRTGRGDAGTGRIEIPREISFPQDAEIPDFFKDTTGEWGVIPLIYLVETRHGTSLH
ncbi:MAG: hypothetical protein F6K41_24310 [Symploca sp. SIO3E6]|nr:hypothetical protein [Caldora sp. SIO3E6]